MDLRLIHGARRIALGGKGRLVALLSASTIVALFVFKIVHAFIRNQQSFLIRFLYKYKSKTSFWMSSLINYVRWGFSLTPPVVLSRAVPLTAGISISLDPLILWNPSQDPLLPNFAFKENSLHFLHALLAHHCQRQSPDAIYLLARTRSDQEKRYIQLLLINSGLLPEFHMNDALHSRNVCTRLAFHTDVGEMTEFIQSIHPRVHIEGEIDLVPQLAALVPLVIHVPKTVCLSSLAGMILLERDEILQSSGSVTGLFSQIFG